ncbi:class I SAM-dependent methyltransferase [Halovivax gelatinilyticus]|uniref:class I SAM-dependent methyltransferase n=1 Tax=Halovivax gelatinilyticus TaxID=2961597 RepID=UPI0020CA6A36|nr:methyltransferase domain-containing protein [Halovivax gelatinilyticus]
MHANQPDERSPTSAQSFYGRWARLYDVIATGTPGIRSLRRRVAEACDLRSGDTVVEFGCGTGANLPYLREVVGESGTVVGIDVTREVLDRAYHRIERAENVHLIRADATNPPISVDSDVDAIVSTFVVGMFDDPAAVVDEWCDLVGPGGRIVLANAARTHGPAAALVNSAFGAVVRLSTPPTRKLRYEDDITGRLDRRISTAHGRLRARATATYEHRSHLGLIRLTGGVVDG